MTETTVLEIGSLRLTRVLYVDVPLDAETLGVTRSEVDSLPWAEPHWATPDGVLAAATAWVVSDGDEHIVIDPFLAADDILHDPGATADHQAAISAAFDAAGLPRAAITQVVVTHHEGVGMLATLVDDGWAPFFPTARIRISETALTAYADMPHHPRTSEAWTALAASGRVETFVDGHELVPGMVAEETGAHAAGHTVFHFGGKPEATFLGHLALTPVSLALGPRPVNDDATAADERLHHFADDGRIVMCSLWPTPGAGRWTGTELVPVTGGG